MDRRDFFTTAAAAAVSAGAAGAACCCPVMGVITVTATAAAGPCDCSIAAESDRLFPLYRLESGRWVRRRMFELVVGDRFRMEAPDIPALHNRIQLVEGLPEISPDSGLWSIYCRDVSSSKAPGGSNV